MQQMLYHIARNEDWQKAKEAKAYTVSTLGKTLDEVGFIHMSFAPQVKVVADFIYASTPDLVLLTIDPGKLTSEVKIEAAAGTDEKFPHLYGPLDVAAVVDASAYRLDKNGQFPAVV